MMITFSKHAENKIEQRRLPKDKVIQTVESSDRILKSRDNRSLATKNFGKLDLRVVFVEEDDRLIIVTAYWHERSRG